MKNKTLNKLLFFILLFHSFSTSSTNQKISLLSDRQQVFPEELKELISIQLKEIWHCENVNFEFSEAPYINLIINIGIIPNPLDKLEDFKLATKYVINDKIKKKYNLNFGKLEYQIVNKQKIKTYGFDLFTIINSVPVANGCNKLSSQLELKKCFKTYIVNFFAEKFKNTGIEKKMHKAIIKFSIDESAQVKNVSIIHENYLINQELLKITKQIKILEPGYMNGNPKTIEYAIPLNFIIE